MGENTYNIVWYVKMTQTQTAVVQYLKTPMTNVFLDTRQSSMVSQKPREPKPCTS